MPLTAQQMKIKVENQARKRYDGVLKSYNDIYTDSTLSKKISLKSLHSLTLDDLTLLQTQLKDLQKIKKKQIEKGYDPVVFAENIEPVPQAEVKTEIDPEFEIYIELKNRDPVNEKEVEIYLKYHKIKGVPLTKDELEFARADLLDRMNNGASRFNLPPQNTPAVLNKPEDKEQLKKPPRNNKQIVEKIQNRKNKILDDLEKTIVNGAI